MRIKTGRVQNGLVEDKNSVQTNMIKMSRRCKSSKNV